MERWSGSPILSSPVKKIPGILGQPRTPDLLLASQRTGSAEEEPPLAFRVTLGLSSASLNFSVSLRNDEVGMGATR